MDPRGYFEQDIDLLAMTETDHDGRNITTCRKYCDCVISWWMLVGYYKSYSRIQLPLEPPVEDLVEDVVESIN